MKKAGVILIGVVVLSTLAAGQTAGDGTFKLALVDHQGQLSWSAEGFKIIQSSAKPGGREIGIRGRDQSGHLTFLGFMFLVPEQAPLTSAKCRDGAVEHHRRRRRRDDERRTGARPERAGRKGRRTLPGTGAIAPQAPGRTLRRDFLADAATSPPAGLRLNVTVPGMCCLPQRTNASNTSPRALPFGVSE